MSKVFTVVFINTEITELKLKSTAHLAREIEATFHAEGKFPGVVGLIDATRVYSCP